MKEIVCADAIRWMAETPRRGAVITSLPDVEEAGLDFQSWPGWFKGACAMAMNLTEDRAPAIFYQTDRKHGGEWLSKPALLIEAADEAGLRLIWHKIVLRRGVGQTDIHRPGFSHLMAFSRKGKPGAATPDVIERGQIIYPNAIGLAVAKACVKFAAQSSRLVLDPFCGRGTIPAVADLFGLDSIGVDIDPAQCEKARLLRLAFASAGSAGG